MKIGDKVRIKSTGWIGTIYSEINLQEADWWVTFMDSGKEGCLPFSESELEVINEPKFTSYWGSPYFDKE